MRPQSSAPPAKSAVRSSAAYLRAARRSPRSFATPARPAELSATPAGCTSVPRSLMTRATSPTNLAGSATCSSRWDQSGSRASCNGSRSTPPPGIPSIVQVTRPLGAQHLDGLTGDQPASPLQHRPVRLLAGGGRMALFDHRDAAEAGVRVLTDPAPWGAHPRPHGTDSDVVARGAQAALSGTRRARHLPRRGRAAVPRAPHRRRGRHHHPRAGRQARRLAGRRSRPAFAFARVSRADANT